MTDSFKVGDLLAQGGQAPYVLLALVQPGQGLLAPLGPDLTAALAASLGADLAGWQKQGELRPPELEAWLKAWSGLLVNSFYQGVQRPKFEQAFVPGESYITFAGRVFDEREMQSLVNASLDFWLTAGKETEAFEKALAKRLGAKKALLVNSGSSANLLAFMTLTSHLLGERRIRRGDEVITVAAGFHTTVAPILQYGAVPVFVDVDLITHNIRVDLLEQALSPKTKAVMLAHTLGNPFDLGAVKAFCEKHNLWLIEDNCDALGSEYQGQMTGSIGDLGTSSFYPPHHLTMGEGGALYTKNAQLAKIAESFRDWGRDCYCPSGKDNTCNRRFAQQLGALPFGYDHKYTYQHLGYNLKATDLQAAIGNIQLTKLDQFTAKRRAHWQRYFDGLQDLASFFHLPQATPGSNPSWFGFALTLKDGVKFERRELQEFLESKKIQTRLVFAGNMTRQPAFDEMRQSGTGYRVVGDLTQTDKVMNDCLWVGVYPGLTNEKIDYVIRQIHQFVQENG